MLRLRSKRLSYGLTSRTEILIDLSCLECRYLEFKPLCTNERYFQDPGLRLAVESLGGQPPSGPTFGSKSTNDIGEAPINRKVGLADRSAYVGPNPPGAFYTS